MARFDYEIRDQKQYVRDTKIGDLLGPFESWAEALAAIKKRRAEMPDLPKPESR